MPVNWNELIKILAPVAGEVAGHGERGAFMQAFMDQQQLAEERKREQADVEQRMKATGADFMLRMGQHAQGIDDPIDFQNFLNMAENAGTTAGYLQPGQLKAGLSFNTTKQHEAQLKELADQLAQLEKAGYDLDALDESGSTLKLKTGQAIPIGTALEITRQRPTSASGQPVPRPKKEPPVTAGSETERAAALQGRIRAAKAKGDMATATTLQAEYDDLIASAGDLSGARRQPVDPDIADMNKTLKQLAIDAALAKKNAPAPALPPDVQRRVNQFEDAFKNEPAVKRTNIIAEGVALVESLSNTTENPADDQALIYAFAKAMDPESVVREGEYATVQKYSQSWIDTFKFDAARVLNNSEFLTPASRRQVKATIRAKFMASKQAYDNARKQYAAQINRATGQTDGESRLLDYAAGYQQDPAAGAQEKLKQR